MRSSIWRNPQFHSDHQFGSRQTAASRAAGFSLVEIMVVVLIISILSMLAIPTVRRVRLKARTAAVVNDFRVFAAAFEAAAHETGRWPAEAAAGVVPAGMEASLKIDAWTRTTPMGGRYNWENNQLHSGTRYQAAIAITATADAPLPLDVKQLRDIDRTIDDGNLRNGNFRLGSGNCPLFIIQK